MMKTQKCQQCGESHRACLVFHHRDPKVKELEVSNCINYSIRKIKEEAAKCDILCANCHRKLHYKEKTGQYASEKN